jgi:hypothetical protein
MVQGALQIGCQTPVPMEEALPAMHFSGQRATLRLRKHMYDARDLEINLWGRTEDSGTIIQRGMVLISNNGLEE